MCLRQRASIRCEVVRDVLQRVLILWTRWDHLLNQPALVELLSMRQDIGDDETPIELPVLRAALIMAEAWSVLDG